MFVFISIRSNKNMYLWKDQNINIQNKGILLVVGIFALIAIYYDVPKVKDTEFGAVVLSYFGIGHLFGVVIMQSLYYYYLEVFVTFFIKSRFYYLYL